MAAEPTYLTTEGEDALREELRTLTETRRPALVRQLSKGRSEGKLRKNADYDDAPERLSQIENRIRQIGETLGRAIIVSSQDPSELDDVRGELGRLEHLRLPQLVSENRELDSRLSRLNAGQLRKRLLARKNQANKRIDRTKRQIADLRNDLTCEVADERKTRLQRSLQKLEEDLPALIAERNGINKELKNLDELRKEYESSRASIESVQEQIKHLSTRLNTIISPATQIELQCELDQLTETRKPALARKLKEAVAQGDLKENADYHDAKEQLGFIEGRVQQIEAILRNAIVVESGGASDEVRIGSTVVIQEEGYDETEEYRIVGSAEANPRESKISEKSPIGSALLGKSPGKKISVSTPDGKIKFKIIEIK